MTAATAATTDRIRRNTACTGCRDSKVKCNASQNDNHAPCSRCTKLGIGCVVDKSHKRSTRRSKLEQLEKELNSIKDVVKTSMAAEPSFRPPSLSSPSTEPSPDIPRPLVSGFLPSALRETLPQLSISVPRPELAVPAAPVAPTVTATATAGVNTSTTIPSSTGNIDYYFDMYFEHFHPYFPIIRSRDPDQTYTDSPLLFWTILCIVSRRYARSATTFEFLIEALPREIWPVLCSHLVPVASINALLLLSMWSLPTERLLSDPALTYASIAVSASLVVGLHTMKGGHAHFCFGPRKMDVSDEEAAYSWAGCNIVGQRVSSINGCPPSLALFNHALRATRQFDSSPYFKNLLTAQAKCNSVAKTMFAVLEQSNTVSESTIQLFESELDSEGALWMNTSEQDLDTFTLLCTRLEIQAYYFTPKPDPESPTLQHNMLRAYQTATNLVDLAIKLEASIRFSHHAPSYVFRHILEAACIIMRVSMTSSLSSLLTCSGNTRNEGSDSASATTANISNCRTALRACSVRENDMPLRTLKIMESFWSLRGVLPPFGPMSELHQRIGSSLTFDSLRRWKVLLEGLQRKRQGMCGMQGKSADEQAVIAATEIPVGLQQTQSHIQPHTATMQPHQQVALQNVVVATGDGIAMGQGVDTTQVDSGAQDQGLYYNQALGQDLGTIMPSMTSGASAEQLQDIDWDALMRDLDWDDVTEPGFPAMG
ncbi:putative transcription factor SEF1 [Ceratocystis fimbriata CBS 114723]|uniref:Putative transcription factor SEF1 n=1 Tax=Ceratocystis fimbriata CBS 114723 TaxID=1035309 RepID=A0A2C5X486_9PEZI|nr:putative transcription factor SEF1 [Ceratocystis fimbriata CBS 114723]